MKTILLSISFVSVLLLGGCTQVVTAPISAAGTVVSTTIDVAGSAAHAVVGDEEEEED